MVARKDDPQVPRSRSAFDIVEAEVDIATVKGRFGLMCTVKGEIGFCPLNTIDKLAAIKFISEALFEEASQREALLMEDDGDDTDQQR